MWYTENGKKRQNKENLKKCLNPLKFSHIFIQIYYYFYLTKNIKQKKIGFVFPSCSTSYIKLYFIFKILKMKNNNKKTRKTKE